VEEAPVGPPAWALNPEKQACMDALRPLIVRPPVLIISLRQWQVQQPLFG
jgi:hypothetical protein